jgi:7-cyano-7-deazaguanine synthase
VRKALVVLSGGQDSATCAAWAHDWFRDGFMCLSFDYGQRHRKELDAAKRIANLFGAPHEIVKMPVLAGNPASGLTNPDLDVNEIDANTQLPKSFLPGRNLVFLTAAASYALSRGMRDVVTGVCETDYSGYPDCRRDTILALERAIQLGTHPLPELSFHTPLMHLSKAETVHLATTLTKGWQALAMSWTCYQGGDRPCGTCPACVLRAAGFKEAGMDDPALAHYTEI